MNFSMAQHCTQLFEAVNKDLQKWVPTRLCTKSPQIACAGLSGKKIILTQRRKVAKKALRNRAVLSGFAPLREKSPPVFIRENPWLKWYCSRLNGSTLRPDPAVNTVDGGRHCRHISYRHSRYLTQSKKTDLNT